MTEFNFHKSEAIKTPPQQSLSVIQKCIASYKLWHEFLPHFAKTSRYTLGEKIDLLFVETIELIFISSRLYKEQKLPFVQKSISKLDLLKFFLQISWEIKALDGKKFIMLSEKLEEVGKILGGWMRQIHKENLAAEGKEK